MSALNICRNCFKKIYNLHALRYSSYVRSKNQLPKVSSVFIKPEDDPSHILKEIKPPVQETYLYDRKRMKTLTESLYCPKEFQKYNIDFSGMDFTVFDNLTMPEQFDYLYNLNLPKGKKLNFRENSEYLKSVTHFHENLKYSVSLNTFFQACIDVGFMKTVENMLYNSTVLITNAIPYNIILHEICKTANFEAFTKLCDHLTTHEVKCNSTTFALLFQCLGTFKKSAYTVEKTKYFLDVMKEKNIKIQKVFENRNFYGHDDTAAKLAITAAGENSAAVSKLCGRYGCTLLADLNDTLHSTDAKSQMQNVMSKDDLKKALRKQIELEKVGLVLLKSVSLFSNGSSEPVNEELPLCWKEQWRDQFSKAFRQYKELLGKSFNSSDFKDISLYPYFNCLDEDEYIDVMCDTLYDMKSAKSIHVPTISIYIGKSLLAKYLQKYSSTSGSDGFIEAYLKLCDWYDDHSANGGGYNSTFMWEMILKEANMLASINPPERLWSKDVQCQIGEAMISLIFDSLTIPITSNGEIVQVPAFGKSYRIGSAEDDDSDFHIKPCQQLLRLQSSRHILFRCDAMPMLCPPLPWLSPIHGGYIHIRKNIFRSIISAKQIQLIDTDPKCLQPILDGLGHLGAVPWKINTEMLDFLLHVFHNGGWTELGIPTDGELCGADVGTEVNFEESKYGTEKRVDLHSLRVNFVHKLTMAEYYRNRIFWLPHCIDFRGRAYPRPSHVTHSDADSYRSYLLFAKGKKLGPAGLRWLKIHVINLNGFMNHKTLDERLQFCEDNLDLIFDSADNPLSGKQWWSRGDIPWQCLAACKDLTKALRSASPEEYVSHLPIHQDGSCNGLQHFAALGLDAVGATAVNVKPSPTPQDVYVQLLDRVMEQVRAGVLLKHREAMQLEPLIDRKIIKKIVMAFVFGGTNAGLTYQINKLLSDSITNALHRNDASKYLSRTSTIALKTMFTSTKEIQNWFQNYATIVTKVFNEEVSWYTPLGLPIVQPYAEQFTTPQEKKRVNSKKHETSFPPNYIHSLDATHMYLTALHCAQSGITFAAVHDCFWMHGCDVDRANVICREQFKNIYSLPLLQDLKLYFDKRYSIGTITRSEKFNVPKLGDFDINEVKSSTYFFS